MAGTEPLGDPAGGRENDRKVGLAVASQRRGQGDRDRVGFANGLIVCRGREDARLDEGSQARPGDVFDVAFATVEELDSLGVDVDENGGYLRLGEDMCEGQTDVTCADDCELPLH
jgi:hypothetical protein